MDFWEIPLRLWEIAQNEKLELGIKFGTERGETQDLELLNSAGFSYCSKTTRMSIILLLIQINLVFLLLQNKANVYNFTLNSKYFGFLIVANKADVLKYTLSKADVNNLILNSKYFGFSYCFKTKRMSTALI